MAFHGDRRPSHGACTAPHHATHGPRHLHDAPPAMAIPLIVLAVGSILAGYVGVPPRLGGANRIEHFLEPVSRHPLPVPRSPQSHEAQACRAGSVELMLMACRRAGARRHRPRGVLLPAAARGAPRGSPRAFPVLSLPAEQGLRRRDLRRGDRSADRRSRKRCLWKAWMPRVIDGAVNGAGTIVAESRRCVRQMQTGSMRAYAVSVLLGAVSIVGLLPVEMNVAAADLAHRRSAARRRVPLIRDRRRPARSLIRRLALAVSLLVFALTLLLWRGSTPPRRTSSSSSGTPGFPRSASTTSSASTASACSWWC